MKCSFSSFLYSSITVSVNISDKPKKWEAFSFHMKIVKKTKWSSCLMHQLILNFNNYLFNRSGKCSKHVPGANCLAQTSTWPNQCMENLSSQRIHLGISVKCCYCTSHISWSIQVPSFQKHLSIAGKIFHPETCSLADKIFEQNVKVKYRMSSVEVFGCLSGYGMWHILLLVLLRDIRQIEYKYFNVHVL